MEEKKSKYYNRVKKWYDSGRWSIEAVKNAVGRWITSDEFTEITGESYDA